MSNVTLENYKKVQEEISKIKEKLNEINEKKEHWFKKKEDLKKELNELIHKIKEIKAEKDRKNLELQQLKEQRDKYNDEVKKLIEGIKKLNKEKGKVFQKYNVKIDPAKIQEKINELEKRVEQEVNFEKEKKLMEEIKKLKKSYEETSEVRQIAEKAQVLDKEIKDTKKKADEFHRKIQEITKDTSYEVFMELSRKINELKKEQEAAFQKFIDFKNEYANASHELNNKMDEYHVLRLVFSKDREAKKIEHEEKQKSFLKEKIKLIEEKFRSKKKLTTEDIIAMQGSSTE